MQKLKYKMLMLDDKPDSLGFLLAMLEEIPFIEKPVLHSDPMKAFKAITEGDFDILFLDMDLQHPELDGIKFMAMLKNPPVTVACSGHSEYVYKTTEVGIERFHGKTMSSRLLGDLMKVLVKEVDTREEAARRDVTELLVRTLEGQDVIVKVSDIYYGDIDNNTLTLHLEEGTVATRMTLKAFLNKLPATNFAKPHNSYFVSLAKVDGINGKKVYLSQRGKDESVPMSQEFAAAFKHKYKIYKQNNPAIG